MSYFVLSGSFEYLCYGSMTMKNSLIIFSEGTVFIRQNLTYKDGPRADGIICRMLIIECKCTIFL